ncbi:MAG TPA: sugar phosphate isomerase/epimerase family protein, partial [Bacilli bacterium]
MKIGVSTYSLSRAIIANELTLLEAMSYIAGVGGQHVEIVPIGFSLTENPELIEEIHHKASELTIEISGYCVGANFITGDKQSYEDEIQRVMREVDIANRLGVKLMRHDAGFSKDLSMRNFLAELPRLVEACQRIADYAAQYGITTSIENHGYFIQSSDRVQTLLSEVNRSNCKTTMDVGNFMCVDEDSVAAVKKNVANASMIHLKDFYLRPSYRNPGEGWFKTESGNYLRGAIVGQGDIDMPEVLRV